MLTCSKEAWHQHKRPEKKCLRSDVRRGWVEFGQRRDTTRRCRRYITGAVPRIAWPDHTMQRVPMEWNAARKTSEKKKRKAKQTKIEREYTANKAKEKKSHPKAYQQPVTTDTFVTSTIDFCRCTYCAYVGILSSFPSKLYPKHLLRLAHALVEAPSSFMPTSMHARPSFFSYCFFLPQSMVGA